MEVCQGCGLQMKMAVHNGLFPLQACLNGKGVLTRAHSVGEMKKPVRSEMLHRRRSLLGDSVPGSPVSE